MGIGFDTAFGIHEDAVAVRAYRSTVLASNLANADTPHYKARDFDFRSVLADAMNGRNAPAMTSTHARHLAAGAPGMGDVEMMYRVPHQDSMDGNTVDPHIEQANFMNNALRYQASLRFLDGKIKGLKSAIRGD